MASASPLNCPIFGYFTDSLTSGEKQAIRSIGLVPILLIWSAVEGDPKPLQQFKEFVGHEPSEKDRGNKQSAAVSIPISHPEIRSISLSIGTNFILRHYPPTGRFQPRRKASMGNAVSPICRFPAPA